MSESNLTRYDYSKHVEDTAYNIVANYRSGEFTSDIGDLLCEIVDSDPWVIYTHKAMKVIEFSDNDCAYFDQMGAVEVSDWSTLFSSAAYFALQQDIMDALHSTEDFDVDDEDTWVIEVWSHEEDVKIGDEVVRVTITEMSDDNVTVEWNGEEYEEPTLKLARDSAYGWIHEPDKLSPWWMVIALVHRVLDERIAELANADEPLVVAAPKPRAWGIPYGARHVDAAGWHIICPACKERIDLVEMKDSESFTGSEYVAHYTAQHELIALVNLE
tara:strand:+ start:1999 stop:2814 length:816 start_codon:yes stop_codon:yes gene_type:complete